jgi:hypothetical protein
MKANPRKTLSYAGSRMAFVGAFALSVITSARAGNLSTDFNLGAPAGVNSYGSAYVDGFGGVGDSGTLKLTEAWYFGQQGSIILDDLDGGASIYGFNARFKILIGGGSQADGFSFNFANDLPDASFGEEGAGTGLTVSFDTWDNGGAEAPAIDLKKGGVTIESYKGGGIFNNAAELFRTGDYVEVVVDVSDQNVLNLTVNGTAVFSGVKGAFTFGPGRFGFGARTGGANDNHFVDDIEITTQTAPPAHPYLISTGPEVGVHEDAVIKLEIGDGTVGQVVPGSIQLTINGSIVIPTISKVGGVTTLSYDPPGLLPSGSHHVVTYSFADNASPSVTQTGTFQFDVRYYRGPNGNIYELIVNGEKTWEEANADAQTRSYHGRPGHLATSTSYEEDVFLNKVLRTSFTFTFNWEVWLGGYQDFGMPPTEGWHWVNNEGPISGINGGATYSNWIGFEPNDYFGQDSENYLTLGLNGLFGWNDFGDFGFATRGGYIVEYEALQIGLDVKPGESPNVINVSNQGKLGVALLSGPTFDARTVLLETIRFGRTGMEASPINKTQTDVNGDGTIDLILTFNFVDTLLACGDTHGYLTGQDAHGGPIKGSDSVQMIGCPVYSLSLQAVQDVNEKTDIELVVTPLLSGYTAPALATKVQLKSYTIAGDLGWTKNVNDVPLTVKPNNTSSGQLSYNDLAYFQKVVGQVSVKNSKTAKTEIIQADTRVLYRPDLAIIAAQAPEQISTSRRFNLSASVVETKGDFGATAKAYLYDGTTLIDTINEISVDAGGNAGLVFSVRLTTVGTHTLTIVIGDETPRDYDYSNNSYSLVIEATEAQLEPTPFYLSYYSRHLHYFREWDDTYSAGVYDSESRYEELYEQLYIPGALSFPVDNVSLSVSVDGAPRPSLQAEEVLPGYTYDDGCTQQSYGSAFLGDSTSFTINSYKDCFGNAYSYVTAYRYVYDQTYFSTVYYKNGPTYTDGPYQSSEGTFLSPATSISTRLVIEANEGKFGGNAELTEFYDYNSYFPFDYVYEGGYERGFQLDDTRYGSASGMTVP